MAGEDARPHKAERLMTRSLFRKLLLSQASSVALAAAAQDHWRRSDAIAWTAGTNVHWPWGIRDE